MIDVSKLSDEEKQELLIALGAYKYKNTKKDFFNREIWPNLSFVENKEIREKIFNLIQELTDFSTGNYSVDNWSGKLRRNHSLGYYSDTIPDAPRYKMCARGILNAIKSAYSDDIQMKGENKR